MFYQPENYGATGDGTTDDTAAIQACLNAAGVGGAVQFRGGATYRINTTYQPTFQTYGGIKPLARQTLLLNGSTLKALPTSSGVGSVINVYGVDGVQLIGPGNVIGERDIHQGSSGEFGHGISIWTASNWYISPGIIITNCWGDGIYIGHKDGQVGTYCTNWLIDNVRVDNVRRNGISVIAGQFGTIRSAYITNVTGTPPAGAIDLEPDNASYPNSDIVIDGLVSRSTFVAIYATVANSRIQITNCDVEALTSAIRIGDNANDISIVGNPRIRAMSSGGSACVDFVANNANTINGVTIEHNHLIGGQFFAVDVVSGYSNLTVKHNTITANNAGQLGFARLLGGGEFTDNNCVIAASAGSGGQQFIQLAGCDYGRNVFRNQSSNAMYAILSGNDLGGDAYLSSNLTRPSGKTGRTMQVLAAFKQVAVGGNVTAGGTSSFQISGTDCLNNAVLVSAFGGGDTTASDAFKVGYSVTSRSTTGCTVTLANNGTATQKLNADVAVIAGA